MPRSTVRPYVAYCWFTWLILTSIVIILRLTLFATTTQGGRFALALTYMFMCWLPVLLLHGYESSRLMLYLDEHNLIRTEEMVYAPFRFMINIGRAYQSIYSSDDDIGDPVVRDYKQSYRALVRFTLIMFFSFPILLILIVI